MSGLCLLAASAVVLGCHERPSTVIPEREVSLVPETADADHTIIEDVEENPQAYYGKRLTFRGEAENVMSDRAFVLEGDNFAFDNDLLVLTRTPISMGHEGIEENQDYVVTGVVRQLVVAEVERELGWDLEPQLEVEYYAQPVVIAERIEEVRELSIWTPYDFTEPEPHGGMWVAPSARESASVEAPVLHVTAYAVQPVEYLGKPVSGTGEVTRVISDRAFYIDAGPGDEVLAVVREDVPEREMIDIDAGQTITIEGLAMPASKVDYVPGTLEQDAKEAIAEEKAFISAHWTDIDIHRSAQ
ncbi:MAG: hypothetical protein ACE37F_09470 [Nannocystaceae bacterium]|nr:hypothetical protein [bacterium]